jgi:hypothetical protein
MPPRGIVTHREKEPLVFGSGLDRQTVHAARDGVVSYGLERIASVDGPLVLEQGSGESSMVTPDRYLKFPRPSLLRVAHENPQTKRITEEGS